MNRSAVGARGAVRVDADYALEYPDGDAPSTEAYASLVRAGEAVLAELDRCVGASLGIKHPVLTALAVLDGAGEPLTPSEIADRVLVASATMTATLDVLERRGWVRRLPNPADRRSVLVEITAEGRAITDLALPGIRVVEKAMMQDLTADERAQLVNLLDKVLRRSAELAERIRPRSPGAGFAPHASDEHDRRVTGGWGGATVPGLLPGGCNVTDDVLDDLFSIRGKTALITGGTRGIGLMIADAYVRAGVKVYVSSRKADVCAEVAARLSEVGDCIGIPADLSTEDECRRLAGEIAGREDRLHVLINNAGATWGAPLAEHDDAAWNRVLNINVKGPFHLTRFLRPLLDAAASEEDPARVINVGSIDGIQVPMMETYSYSTAKAGVHQLTRHLASQLAPRITVNAIAPGPFESKMMAATLDAFGDAIAESAPMKRIGKPADMAGIAVYLAGPASTYVTGAIIPVDGGIATCK